MAFYHSIYGMFVGVIQGSTLGTRPLYAKDGFVGLSLSVGPAGSETLVGGAASVTTPTTAQTIASGGTSIFPATAAKSYNLGAPAAGARKTLVATSTSTAVRTITLASGNFTSTAISTGASIAFNGIGQVVELIGLSTAAWFVTDNTGATLA